MALDLAEFFKNYAATRVGFDAEPAKDTTFVSRLVPEGSTVLEIAGAAGVAAALEARACDVRRIALADLRNVSLERVAGGTRYDVVLLSDALAYVAEPEKLLQQCRSLLKADGFIAASVANAAHGAVRLAMLAGESVRDGEVSERLHDFTASALNAVFTRAGYRVEDLQRISAPWDDLAGVERSARADESLIRQIQSDPESDTLMFAVKAAPVLRALPQPDELEPAFLRETQLLKGQLESAESLIGELRAAGRALRIQNAELRRAKPEPDTHEADGLRLELEAARNLHMELTERLQTFASEITGLRLDLHERARQTASLEGALQETLNSVCQVTAQRDELLTRMHQMDASARQSEETMAELKRTLNRQTQESKAKIDSLLDQKSQLLKRAGTAEAQRDHLQKRTEAANEQTSGLQQRLKAAEEQNSALQKRAETAERLLMEQTRGLLESTQVEIQKLSDLVDAVQTSRFWKLKAFVGRLLRRQR